MLIFCPIFRRSATFLTDAVETHQTRLGPVEKTDLSVILLTGGTSARMGRDKADLPFGPDTLLMFQLARIPPGIQIIVVGESHDSLPAVVFTRENPVGSGPVAAVAAGLEFVDSPCVVLLGVDTPFALPHLLSLELAPAVDALIPRDLMGKLQYLTGIYRTQSVRWALDRIGPPVGKSMRQLIGELPTVEHVQLTSGNAESFLDIDTPADLAAALEMLRRHPKVGP